MQIEVGDREEITVALIGNVDSGKSTTVGILTNPGTKDDGKGSARASVMIHPHELESGRTSDVSYRHYADESRVYTFVDLAGHEAYLKTTISGLSSCHPDLAIVCISDKITHMTREHISLALNLGIPTVLVFTKIDLIPNPTAKRIVKFMKRLISKAGKKMYQVRSIKDYHLIKKNPHAIIPYISTSNKTGDGIELLREILSVCPKRNVKHANGFVIEKIYHNVKGFGTVITGTTGINISTGDELYLGPLHNGKFKIVKVKTIHNDYRSFIDVLGENARGCLCIKIQKSDRHLLRHGLILNHIIPQNVCRKFQAKVKIFHHSTSILDGYQAFVNCGGVRGTVVFTNVENKVLRSGDEALVDMEFMKHLNYLEIGQKVLFREGTTRGVGQVVKIY